MNSTQTFLWDHSFNLPHPSQCIFQKIVDSLSKQKFNGESDIRAINHLFESITKCRSQRITNEDVVCRIFTLTLKGWIRKWFDSFTIESIHSWRQFIEIFLLVHQNYDYNKLCDKIKYLYREENESIAYLELPYSSMKVDTHLVNHALYRC